ncbi:MAG: helix-turn-helix domain-containing protein [Bdellovibrionales bacterium]
MSISLTDISSKLDLLTAAVLTNKAVLNIEEAAAYTGLAVSYLYKLTSTQEVPHFKPRGKRLYFNRLELEDWLQSRRVNTVTEISHAAAKHIVGGAV